MSDMGDISGACRGQCRSLRRTQIARVVDHALVERSRVRAARAIGAPGCTTAPRSRALFAARHSGNNAQQGVAAAWLLFTIQVANRMSTRNKPQRLMRLASGFGPATGNEYRRYLEADANPGAVAKREVEAHLPPGEGWGLRHYKMFHSNYQWCPIISFLATALIARAGS